MLEINIEKALKNGTLQEKIDNMKREIERMDNEIKRCEKALEKSKMPKLAIPFIPKDKDRFCVYNRYGKISSGFLVSKNDLETAMLLGAYKTEEETKLAYEKRKAEIELLMMCDGLEKRTCFVPYFDDNELFVGRCAWYKPCPYRFASKESCQKAIKKLGDHKLRLIFNIPLED